MTQPTRKIAINIEYGGFCLSEAAIRSYADRTGRTLRPYDDIARDDPDLIAVLEALGGGASPYGSIRIIEIPADVEWHIEEYDGKEWVAENHRTWEYDPQQAFPLTPPDPAES